MKRPWYAAGVPESRAGKLKVGLCWAAALWLGLVLVAPLLELASAARSLAPEAAVSVLPRVFGRGLLLAALVATAATACAAVLARTVAPLALLAPVLIARSLTAHGALALGADPGVGPAALSLLVDCVPLGALLIALRLRTRPAQLLDAAADLGAGLGDRLRFVDWPHLRSALLITWVWTALQVLGDTVAFEIAGGGKVYTPGLMIRDALIHDGAPGRALLAILLLLAAALPCAWGIARELDVAEYARRRRQPPAGLGLRILGHVLLAACLLVPAAALFGPRPEALTHQDRLLAELLGQSLGLAGIVAALAAVLGFFLALGLRGARGDRRARTATTLLLLPLALPAAIFGLLAVSAAGRVGLEPGPSLTVLALMPTALALGLLVARVLCATIPSALLEAAADLGAGAWLRLREVWLPLGAPALGVALLLVGAWVLGQAAIPSFTSGPGGDTLAVGLTVLARGGAWPVVRRWSLALVLAPSLAIVSVYLLTRWRRRRRRG